MSLEVLISETDLVPLVLKFQGYTSGYSVPAMKENDSKNDERK